MKIISNKIILIRNEDGFTLIEIMAAILIMVTLVTLIISFYLFANKFIRTTTINFDEREKINGFVFDLSDIINKSTGFDLLTNQKKVILQLNDGKKITFANGAISIDRYYKLTNIENYKFLLHFEDGNNLIIDSNKNTEEKKISVEQISSMDIEINYKSKKYLIDYYKPEISELKFINIE